MTSTLELFWSPGWHPFLATGSEPPRFAAASGTAQLESGLLPSPFLLAAALLPARDPMVPLMSSGWGAQLDHLGCGQGLVQ